MAEKERPAGGQNSYDDRLIGARDNALYFRFETADHHWVDEWLESCGLQAPCDDHDRDARRALILAAFMHAAGTPTPGRTGWLSYPRADHAYYGATDELFRPRYVRDNIDRFDHAGIILHNRKPPGEHLRSGRQSSFRLKASAVESLIRAFPENVEVRHITRALIEVRGKDGLPLPIRKSQVWRRLRRNQECLNEMTGAAKLGLDLLGFERLGQVLVNRCAGKDGKSLQFINMANDQARRIYIQNMSLCGRQYGPFWHNMTGEQRAQLTINDEPTIEIDYRCHHPKILADLAGFELNWDPYTTGLQTRKEGKIDWNILINASDQKSAHKAIIQEVMAGDPLWCDGENARQAMKRMEAIERRNKLFEPYFYKGYGLRLQNIDSDIMVRLQLNLLKRGITTASVHDSVIGQDRHEGDIDEEKDRSFEQTMRRFAA